LEIYLIRHTTPAIPKGFIYGRTDVPLTDTFSQEIDVIRQKLPPDLGTVYASPSTRCTRLAEQLAINYKTDERLYEVNFGKWEGKTWDTIDLEALSTWMKDYVNISPPEGESMVQMQQRVLGFWQELLLQPSKKIVVITHGGVIRLILAKINNIPLQSAFEIKVGYGDIFLIKAALTKKL